MYVRLPAVLAYGTDLLQGLGNLGFSLAKASESSGAYMPLEIPSDHPTWTDSRRCTYAICVRCVNLIVIAGQRRVDGDMLSEPKDKQTFIRRTLSKSDERSVDTALTPQEYLQQADARKDLHVVVSSPVMQ